MSLKDISRKWDGYEDEEEEEAEGNSLMHWEMEKYIGS